MTKIKHAGHVHGPLTNEAWLQLACDLQGLTGAEHPSRETRLHAVDEALNRAIGDRVESARDFIRDVILGLVTYDQDDPDDPDGLWRTGGG